MRAPGEADKRRQIRLTREIADAPLLFALCREVAEDARDQADDEPAPIFLIEPFGPLPLRQLARDQPRVDQRVAGVVHRVREHEQIAARAVQRRQGGVEDLGALEVAVLGDDHASERQAAHARRLVAAEEQEARVVAGDHGRDLEREARLGSCIAWSKRPTSAATSLPLFR